MCDDWRTLSASRCRFRCGTGALYVHSYTFDRHLALFAALVAAALSLWDLLPPARAWITPSSFLILCAPLWLTLTLADASPPQRRAWLSRAFHASLIALAALALTLAQGAR